MMTVTVHSFAPTLRRGLAVTTICVAVGISNIVQPSLASDERWQHYGVGRAAHRKLRHARLDWNEHRVD